MRKSGWTVGSLCLLLGLAHTLVVLGQTTSAKRAQPPQFDKATTDVPFFDNVFSRLVGERPANLGQSAQPQLAGSSASTPMGQPAGGSEGYAWTQIISPTTIEDEIKAIKLDVDKQVTTPSDFAGRGYKQIRKQFSVLAMLFAIVGQYDGQVRWQDDAAAARDLFARTAANAKVGTIQVYNEAKIRKDELADLVRGSRLQSRGEAETNWGEVCDRSPLMQRLEISFQDKLAPWTNNKEEFAANKEEILHEAELLAAISEVLTLEGMQDADDDDYAEFSVQMKNAALEIVGAVKLDNYEQARQSAGDIRKACSECHELYRG